MPAVDWEATLRTWSKPANEKQEQRANATAAQVRRALAGYEPVDNSMMKVAAQGSKLNNTDTIDESDVDIRVELHLDQSQPDELPPIFFPRRTAVAKSLTREELGLTAVDLPVSQNTFKDHIARALEEQFGKTNVDRHDKCIKVDESRLTFPADIVPCFPMRLFSDRDRFEPGIIIKADSGDEIANFPEQHYRNGVDKNLRTNSRFKKMVRCLKRLENELLQRGRLTEALPSFYMECLIYNCPDRFFDDKSYQRTFSRLMVHLYGVLEDPAQAAKMIEVNEVKSLFLDGQDWTPEQGSNLAAMAWYAVEKT